MSPELLRICKILFGLIIFQGSFAFAGECIPLENLRKHSRFPVVFKGPEWLRGAYVDRIEAWRFSNKSWSKASIQVDEVNAEGNYVLEEGLPFTKFSDDGFLDHNDEISVLGTNLGSPFETKDVSKDLFKRFRKFRRIDFCAENSDFIGSLLVGQIDLPGRVPEFIPLFSRANAEVLTSKYRYTFRSSQPMLMGDVRIKTLSGEQQVFVGSNFVMPLIPRVFVFPSLYFGESDFSSEIECWRSGPVRSIVAVGAKMKKFFSLIDLHLFSELVFYEDFFQIPTKIEFIFNPATYLAPGSGIAYILKYPPGIDWKLNSNLAPLPQSGPVKGELKETAFDVAKDGAFAVRGFSNLGSFVANVRVDKKALKQAPPPFLANQGSFGDAKLQSEWPWLKKANGSLGVFIEISRVNHGLYDFALDVALSNQANDDFTDFQPVTAIWPDSTEFEK